MDEYIEVLNKILSELQALNRNMGTYIKDTNVDNFRRIYDMVDETASAVKKIEHDMSSIVEHLEE